MIRMSRVWLVLAALVLAAIPAMAETVLPLPDRNPARAMPRSKTAEAPERGYPWERDRPAPAAPEAAPIPERAPAAVQVPHSAPVPQRYPVAVEAPDAAAVPEPAPQPIETAESATAGDTSEDPAKGEAIVSAPDNAPLPERKPLPGDRPTVAWMNPKIAAARERCAELLKRSTIDYEKLQPIKQGACGAPAPILVKSIGADLPVAIEPPATVRCPLAVALDTWLIDQVQPAALEAFGSPVAKIRNISSYKCRNRYNAPNTKISEHAFANALDISEFELASGKRITVLRGWPRIVRPSTPPPPDPKPDREPTVVTKINVWASEPPLPPPEASPPSGPEPRDESEFLQLIHKDACKTFNTVLGPRANAAHKNHFHVDMKVRRYVTICE